VRATRTRRGAERVLDFCTPAQYPEFMRSCPEFERMLVDSGTHLIKLWFSGSRAEQAARFAARSLVPVKQEKLSATDRASMDKWQAYTEAEEAMFFYTDTRHAPWTVIESTTRSGHG